MKVCHVTSGHSPFDVRIYHKECRSLAGAGYDVTLIAPADFRERTAGSIRVLGISRSARLRRRTLLWPQILHHIRIVKPDIVHFHDPDLLLLTLVLGRHHLVYDCHELNTASMLSKPWLPRPLRRSAARLAAVLEPALAERATAVVLVADSQLGTFQGIGKPLVMVRNYPIVDEVPVRRWDRPSNVVVHVGAQARLRGSSVMVEALAQVKREVPGVELWLVGPFNHRPYEQEVRQLITRLGLDGTVKMFGPTAYPQTLQRVAQATVGLVGYQASSHYMECLPTKLLEYMAAGIPVVASDVPANRSIIGDSDCGYLVRPDDPGQYASAIFHLLRDGDEARRLGLKGRQVAETQYNWGTEAQNLFALYASILDRTDGRVVPESVHGSQTAAGMPSRIGD